jgi:hypothetical protein
MRVSEPPSDSLGAFLFIWGIFVRKPVRGMAQENNYAQPFLYSEIFAPVFS